MRWAVPKSEPAKWKRWFAWRPVEIGGQRVWLEWVERKREWVGAHDGYYPFDTYRDEHREPIRH